LPGAGALPAPLGSAGTTPEPAQANIGHYEAAVFAVSRVELPAISVKYRLPDGSEGELASAPVPLRILSVLPKDPAEQKLADIRGPISLPVGAPFWLGVAGLALLLAVVGVCWWRRRRRRAPAGPLPAQQGPPDVEARAALDRLAASGAVGRGEYRPFYISLTEIAKRYLERRLEAPVLEMTSSEMLGYLRDHPHGCAFAALLRDLTGAADQVKFAGGRGQAEEAQRHLAAVRQVVDALEAKLRPPAAEREKVA
jgi:hypothetical protein